MSVLLPSAARSPCWRSTTRLSSWPRVLSITFPSRSALSLPPSPRHRAHGSGGIFSADLVEGAGGEEYDQQGVPAAALAALTGWRVVQIGIGLGGGI